MKLEFETLTQYADQRGWVYEPIGEEDLTAQKNSHVVLTEPGFVRGNHYHEQATEIMIVHGPALVRFQAEGETVEDHLVPDGEIHRTTIPPRVAHAIKNTGTAPHLLVAFSDQIHDRTKPDVIAKILIPFTD